MKSKTKSPRRFALYLGAAVLGYFVCGFVAQRMLAEDAPKGATFGKVTFYNSPTIATYDIDGQMMDASSGLVRNLKVGDALLTKKSVRLLINTLELANVICRWQQEDMEKRSAEYPSNILAKENIATVAKTRDDIKNQIIELTKLSDALAEAQPK